MITFIDSTDQKGKKRRSKRVRKMVHDDSFEVYSPLSDDESFNRKPRNPPSRQRGKPRQPKEPKEPKEAKEIKETKEQKELDEHKEPREENSKIETTDNQNKTTYKQRKDVIFKKILRGCKKYYLQEFSTFSQKKSKKEIASLTKA